MTPVAIHSETEHLQNIQLEIGGPGGVERRRVGELVWSCTMELNTGQERPKAAPTADDVALGRVMSIWQFGEAARRDPVLLNMRFLVGLVSGDAGMVRLELFVGPLFQGALCFFLLDIGLIAARRLMEGGRKLSPGVVGFALGFPVLSAGVALGLARLAGLEAGNAALLTILAGSASYIAVPAAMRLAAPKADAGVFVAASLAITFPFNLTLGDVGSRLAGSGMIGVDREPGGALRRRRSAAKRRASSQKFLARPFPIPVR